MDTKFQYIPSPFKRENSSGYDSVGSPSPENSYSFKKIRLQSQNTTDLEDDMDSVSSENDNLGKFSANRKISALVQSKVNYWHAAQSTDGNLVQGLSATRTIETIAYEILEETLRNIPYHQHVCRLYSQQLSSRIMEAIKALGVRRYKYVAVVSLCSLKESLGIHFGSRCLWDEGQDSFASVSYSNDTLLAVALLYGLHIND